MGDLRRAWCGRRRTAGALAVRLRGVTSPVTLNRKLKELSQSRCGRSDAGQPDPPLVREESEMTKLMRQTGDRLLGLFLPTATAGACVPNQGDPCTSCT